MLRGAAICGVVAYHLAWNLWFFSFLDDDFVFGPAMTFVSRAGGSLFLFVAGVSLVLAHGETVRWPSFLRRLALLTVAASAVSVVTWTLFPDEFVYFGILHCIAAASVLGVLFVRAPAVLVVAAAAALVVVPATFNGIDSGSYVVAWTGLSANAPASHDYWPLLPWSAATLAGVAFARLQFGALVVRPAAAFPGGALGTFLEATGRRSLAIYLVHQPVLFASVAAVASLLEAP